MNGFRASTGPSRAEAFMVTSGVGVLLGLMVVVALLVFVSRRLLGVSERFLAGSWLPLASLLLALAFRSQLGRSILAVVMLVAVMSLCMVGIGISLIIRARREGSISTAGLVTATIVAGTPLLLGLVTMCRSKGA
jgi:hypothetical protein